MSEQNEPQDKTEPQPLATRPPREREVRVVIDETPLAYLFDTGRFEHLWRLAGALAASNLIPKHLREDKHGELPRETVRANVFLVINQAIRWGFDPIGLFRETYVVGGVLGYQGKLVAAVINARAGLKRKLDYEFTGEPGTPEFQVTVIGTFKGEEDPRTVTLTVAQAKTANDIWVRDPEQKLCYSGAIKFCRRHCPELMLGVLTDDDVDKIAASYSKPAQAQVVDKPNFSTTDLDTVPSETAKEAQ